MRCMGNIECGVSRPTFPTGSQLEVQRPSTTRGYAQSGPARAADARARRASTIGLWRAWRWRRLRSLGECTGPRRPPSLTIEETSNRAWNGPYSSTATSPHSPETSNRAWNGPSIALQQKMSLKLKPNPIYDLHSAPDRVHLQSCLMKTHPCVNEVGAPDNGPGQR